MRDVTELVIIIDKSGSMQPLTEDVIGGFNSLVEEQKKEGETIVTTIFFNDSIKFIHERTDIKEVKPLDKRTYCASGCTALLDAIGDGIAFIKSKHASTREENLPKNTIFSIMTDGLENASREYSYKKIKGMIEFQKKCGWDFIFQAANIDTEYEANRLGIDADMAMSFEANPEGVKTQMKYCSAKIRDVRKNSKKK